jgi:hypothetical protein
MPVKPPSSARPVPIGNFMMRRVFLKGNKFVCGICRKAYASAEDANGCLHQCWQKVLQQAPWTSVKRLGKTEYHCIYCQRAYENQEGAASCAADCAEKMTITSHEAGTILGSRAKKTFGQRPPVKISLKVPYKITKSAPETPTDFTTESGKSESAAAAAETAAKPLDTKQEEANPTAHEEPKDESKH